VLAKGWRRFAFRAETTTGDTGSQTRFATCHQSSASRRQPIGLDAHAGGSRQPLPRPGCHAPRIARRGFREPLSPARSSLL